MKNKSIYRIDFLKDNFANLSFGQLANMMMECPDSVPKSLITHEFLMDFIRTYDTMLDKIPYELRDEEICMQAIKTNLAAFDKIPQHVMTKKLVKFALERSPNVIGKIPDDLLTEKMCYDAIHRNPSVIGNIPDKLLSYEMCLEAVKGNGNVFTRIKKAFIDEELCFVAVTNGCYLAYIPEVMRTPDICMAAVQHEPTSLDYVPQKYRSKKICTAALLGNLKSAAFVDFNHFDAADILDILKQADEKYHKSFDFRYEFVGNLLQVLPEKLFSVELCKEAIRLHPDNLEYIPDKLKTYELCLESVKNDGNLKYVPEKFRDEEMCRAAFEQDPVKAIRHIPERIPQQSKYKLKIQDSASSLDEEHDVEQEPCMRM